nr:MAG TPA: hypothetical protein [Crassvirales sp.]
MLILYPSRPHHLSTIGHFFTKILSVRLPSEVSSHLSQILIQPY